MCPARIAIGALVAAGATSAGGLTELVVKTLRRPARSVSTRQPKPEESQRQHNLVVSRDEWFARRTQHLS
jgi:hypothetical protein